MPRSIGPCGTAVEPPHRAKQRSEHAHHQNDRQDRLAPRQCATLQTLLSAARCHAAAATNPATRQLQLAAPAHGATGTALYVGRDRNAVDHQRPQQPDAGHNQCAAHRWHRVRSDSRQRSRPPQVRARTATAHSSSPRRPAGGRATAVHRRRATALRGPATAGSGPDQRRQPGQPHHQRREDDPDQTQPHPMRRSQTPHDDQRQEVPWEATEMGSRPRQRRTATRKAQLPDLTDDRRAIHTLAQPTVRAAGAAPPPP